MNKASYEIVGVARDIRHKGPGTAPEPEMFVAMAQGSPNRGATLIVRIAGSAEAVIPSIKARIFALVPGKPITEIASLEETARRAAAPRRFNMVVLTILAAVALGIAAIGIYAVMAHIAGARTREVGIRMALGARREDIRGLFLRQGAAVVAVGLTAGVLGAWYLARSVERFLFDVRVHDERVFAAAAVLLAIVGLGRLLAPGPPRGAGGSAHRAAIAVARCGGPRAAAPGSRCRQRLAVCVRRQVSVCAYLNRPCLARMCHPSLLVSRNPQGSRANSENADEVDSVRIMDVDV